MPSGFRGTRDDIPKPTRWIVICDFPPCDEQAKYVAKNSKSRRPMIRLCPEHTVQLDRLRQGWEIEHRPFSEQDMW